MNLLVDIGNSRTKYVFETNGSFSEVFTVDNNVLRVEWFQNQWSSVRRLYVASVSHKELSTAIGSWSRLAGIDCEIVASEAERFGVKSAYENEKSLGVDRWLALVGANKLYPQKNALVIDAGTATTIDILDACGVHHGGWIIPGINLMTTSLFAGTSNVIADPINSASTAFGKSTTACVNNGVWGATLGAINIATKQAGKLIGNVDYIILTGGNGRKLQQLATYPTALHPDLLFHGLQLYSTA